VQTLNLRKFFFEKLKEVIEEIIVVNVGPSGHR
jgi:hypothetical protein